MSALHGPDHEKGTTLHKAFLVYHIRVPHVNGDRVSYVSDDPRRLRKWSADELRRAYDELHGAR